ncbi:MAG TPA: sigma 54-interacting transcriptional regulator [Symbiobacteriaceae bacterium]|nr:sigma 54-interacting transcriptional regulator [Symbiobacteriaceae bacterium]
MDEQSVHSRDLLTATIETSYDGIAIADARGIIFQVNSSYERITGISRDQVVGRSGRDLAKSGIFSDYLADKIFATRQPVMMVQRYSTGRSAVVVGNPMLDENGQVSLIVFNVRDVTEMHSLRSQLTAQREESERYRAEAMQLRLASGDTGDVVANSQCMRELLQLTLVLAQVDSTVLLLGESGVGKGVLARSIHRHSPRAAGPLISVNCAALPEALLEAELFGYVGGAFTGARSQGKPGLFEVADGGTLFLDEVSEMAPAVQAKLLQVLQDREVRRVGATESRKVNVRIVAATNRDLDEQVKTGQFREDLFYRLSVVPVLIPPLRERPEDVLGLLHHFLERFNQRYHLARHLTNEAITHLLEYRWPGNVRELENVVERLVVTAPANEIRAEDLPPPLRGFRRDARVVVLGLMPLQEACREVERQLFVEASRQLGSTRKVAKVLEISQATAARRMKQLLGDSTGNSQ